MAIKVQKVVADFETTTDKNDVRVWAACAVDIDTSQTVHLDNSIDKFFEWLKGRNTICYFHNLKFDGEFILHWLLTHKFKHVENPKWPGEFGTLITDDGIFYSITVIFEKLNKQYKKVVFYDSYKKLPFKVSKIAKDFQLEDSKGEIDYKAFRAPGHILTDEEKDYIVKDCRIVAQALKIQFEQELTKMTTASDAMNGYKKIIQRNNFDRWFPVLPLALDSDIRQAYKGGFVWLNPKHRNKKIKKGITFDVNSLYPSRMYDEVLPYGYPMFFEGEPQPDPVYNLYILRVRCAFEIKPGHIPCIQLKNNRSYIETEYLTNSRTKRNGPLEIVEMTVTNVDWQLIQDHYKLLNVEYVCGWKFKGTKGMFKDYIDYWMNVKETSTGAIRQLAKLMLNSLYGKFASNPKGRQKLPQIDHDGIVRYKLSDIEYKDPIYTAMACFITAYSRNLTIRSAQSVYDRFVYADTDSLTLTGAEEPDNLNIHPTHLGAWKNEGVFENGVYLRAKTYIKTVDGELKVTCAGMPDNVKELVTYDNFHPGATFGGKLMPRRYPGGIVLEDTTFTIK